MTNRYFIVNTNDTNLNAIFEIAIQDASTARYSLDGDKVVIKLPVGFEGIPDILSAYIECTHEEILSALTGAEWTISQNIGI